MVWNDSYHLISAVFSVASFELAQNKLWALQHSHDFMDLMWKQGIAVPVRQRNSWNSSDERRVLMLGFNSLLSNLTSKLSFTKLPSLLGWLVCPSRMNCSQTIVNVKYYWEVPFPKMEYYILLINWPSIFRSDIYVSIMSWRSQLV